MTIRALAAYMLVFTVGLLAGDWLLRGPTFARENIAPRVAFGALAVGLVWMFKRFRSTKA